MCERCRRSVSIVPEELDPDSFEHLVTFGPRECEPWDLLVTERTYEARLVEFETYKHKKDLLFGGFAETDIDKALHFAVTI